jgi:hypothetical protein
MGIFVLTICTMLIGQPAIPGDTTRVDISPTIRTMLIGQPAIPGDTTRVDISPTKKTQITLSISSSPTRAEIYINKKPGKKTSPDAYTPATLKSLKKTQMSLTLFKKGYLDTTLLLDLGPTATKNFNIFMVPLYVEALKGQEKFLQDRFYVQLGKYCFISVPVFLAAGAGFLYYAGLNKTKADEARSFIDKSIVQSGPAFDAMQKQYTNETRKRNIKFITGAVMFGVAAVDLGAGIVLYF